MNRTRIAAISLLVSSFAVACAQGQTDFEPEDLAADPSFGEVGSPAFSMLDACSAACATAGTASCPDFAQETCFDQCIDMQSATDCHDTAHELVMCWTTEVELCGAPATGSCEDATRAHSTCVTGVEPEPVEMPTTSGGGGDSCSHSECVAGEALFSSCSPCAADVCEQDSYCCDSEWDDLCTDLAAQSLVCDC